MNTTKQYLIRNILAVCVLLPVCTSAQIKKYHFNQVDSLQKVEKRKLLVFIHTDWCRYCEGMNNITFKNKEVANIIENDFYFIELNAEEKNDIVFNGYIYVYKRTGTSTGLHQLAGQLATIDKEIAYPTLCFLNEKSEIIYQLKNYIKAKELSFILKHL